jgi:hypothetical protein
VCVCVCVCTCSCLCGVKCGSGRKLAKHRRSCAVYRRELAALAATLPSATANDLFEGDGADDVYGTNAGAQGAVASTKYSDDSDDARVPAGSDDDCDDIDDDDDDDASTAPVTSPSHNLWTSDEDAILVRMHKAGYTRKQIAQCLINRTVTSVKCRTALMYKNATLVHTCSCGASFATWRLWRRHRAGCAKRLRAADGTSVVARAATRAEDTTDDVALPAGSATREKKAAPVWTESEDAILCEMYLGGRDYDEMVRRLASRSLASVQSRIGFLKQSARIPAQRKCVRAVAISLSCFFV